MAISWRARHEVYAHCKPAPDFLAVEDDVVVGRVFQIQHTANAGRWFWTVMSSTGDLPDGIHTCGVAERREDAAQYVSVLCSASKIDSSP